MAALILIDDVDFVVGGPVSISALALALAPDMAGIRLAVITRNVMLNQIRNQLDAGGGPATIKFYNGAQPADGDTAPSGVLLATLVLSDPAAADAVGGILSFEPINSANVVSNGTCTWARLQDSAGANVLDGPVEQG